MESFGDVVKYLDEQIADAKSHLDRLQTARTALAGDNGGAPAAPAAPARRGPGRPPGSGTKATTSTRKRGRQANRAVEAVKLVTEQPGITIPQIAKSMGIAPNYLYRVLPRLEKAGEVKKVGHGYEPVVAAS